ncbi:MAG: hypothetical protein WC756_12125 [Taibaiella sp.]|jgi:hypothetical protein
MALSFAAVREAYKVFHELGITNVPSWPEDMASWNHNKKCNPPTDTVLGFDIKHDNGWENLVVFLKNPSEEFKQKFDELKKRVPNSSIAQRYSENRSYWIFGWF